MKRSAAAGHYSLSIGSKRSEPVRTARSVLLQRGGPGKLRGAEAASSE